MGHQPIPTGVLLKIPLSVRGISPFVLFYFFFSDPIHFNSMGSFRETPITEELNDDTFCSRENRDQLFEILKSITGQDGYITEWSF